MVLQDVPQLQLAAAAAEAVPRRGGAGLQQLVGERRQAQEGQRPPGRREPADRGVHRQVPQLRYRSAHGFNQRPRFEQVVGYLEGMSRCPWISHKPLLPGRFCAVQREPQPSAPAAHASASNFRGRLPHSAEATDEDVRRARRYQGYGGTRFVDDLAGDPEAGALASNGQGPPSITDRLRSTADGAQAAANLIAGAAGLAAAQAFRSQLPQDAAD